MEKSKLYKGIQTLCIKNDTNIAQLAIKIDKNPSNFYKRLQKSKLSDEEIEYIANQLGYTFDYTFKPLPKKKQIIYEKGEPYIDTYKNNLV